MCNVVPSLWVSIERAILLKCLRKHHTWMASLLSSHVSFSSQVNSHWWANRGIMWICKEFLHEMFMCTFPKWYCFTPSDRSSYTQTAWAPLNAGCRVVGAMWGVLAPHRLSLVQFWVHALEPKSLSQCPSNMWAFCPGFHNSAASAFPYFSFHQATLTT